MNGTLELPGILVQLSHIRLPNVLEKSVGANTPGEDIRTVGKLFSECISNQQAANLIQLSHVENKIWISPAAKLLCLNVACDNLGLQ